MSLRSRAVMALFLPAAPALASESTGPLKQDGAVAPASGPAAKPKERKICVRDTDTGSILPKTVCRTVSEAQQANAQSVHDLDHINAETRHSPIRN